MSICRKKPYWVQVKQYKKKPDKVDVIEPRGRDLNKYLLKFSPITLAHTSLVEIMACDKKEAKKLGLKRLRREHAI